MCHQGGGGNLEYSFCVGGFLLSGSEGSLVGLLERSSK